MKDSKLRVFTMEQEGQDLLEEYHDAVETYIEQHCSSKSASNRKAIDLVTEQFKQNGLKIRYGRWTVQEKKLLNENFQKFVESHSEEIGDPVDFITVSDDKARAHEVRRLKKELRFERCLSTGLYRETHHVMSHTGHTLDPLAVSNGQKYSVEDLHLLKSLVDRYGKRWKIISQEMGRSQVSLQSAHRNFFLHDGYTRCHPTVKQQKRLIKEMRKHFPDTDFSCETISDVPWNEIANKIGYMHGKYLCSFWESKVKYVDDKGKIRLKQPVKPPVELIRKFVKHVARQKPTHPDGLDWRHYYKMFAGYTPGIIALKAIIPALLRKYKIDVGVTPYPEAVKELHKYMKRTKKLGFQSIWEEINAESVKFVRWQQFHWALSPDLAHYVHDAPMMYIGFGESSSDPVVKEERMDIDAVW